MRPIRETIPVEEAHGARARSGDADRSRRTRRRSARPTVACSRASVVAVSRRAAVRPRGDGRLRGDRRRHVRRRPQRSEAAALDRDESISGDAAARRIGAGECVEIATGAPVPEGADAVVMVEETEKAASTAFASSRRSTRDSMSDDGPTDIAAGQPVVTTGDVLTRCQDRRARRGWHDDGGSLRAAAASRSSRPATRLVEPGQPLGAGPDLRHQPFHTVVDRRGRTAACRVTAATVSDTLDDLVEAIRSAASADLMIFSGGSSVGERDLMFDALQQTGEVIFHGIAVKPGKPTILGRVNGRPVLGMPGNPTSCLSNAYLLRGRRCCDVSRGCQHYQPRTVHVPLVAADRVDDRAAPVLHRSRRLTAPLCRRSKGRATSPAWRTPMATSKYPPRPTSSKPEKSWK